MKKRFQGKGYYDKRIEAGLCPYCEEPPSVGVMCLTCWFKATATNHLGTRTRWVDLKTIWDRQKGRCVYTDLVLVPGPRGSGNASLDHKVPRMRGGTDRTDNLQWVTAEINRMKTDMAEDTFFSMCQLVLDNRKSSRPLLTQE